MAIDNTRSRSRKPVNRSHCVLRPDHADTNLLYDTVVPSSDSSADLGTDTQHDWRHSRLLCRAAILARTRPRNNSARLTRRTNVLRTLSRNDSRTTASER